VSTAIPATKYSGQYQSKAVLRMMTTMMMMFRLYNVLSLCYASCAQQEYRQQKEQENKG
jgi:hypothetical protein